MSKEIKALEELMESLSKEYEEALQSEEATQIAYREGYIAGVELAIELLKENTKDE